MHVARSSRLTLSSTLTFWDPCVGYFVDPPTSKDWVGMITIISKWVTHAYDMGFLCHAFSLSWLSGIDNEGGVLNS